MTRTVGLFGVPFCAVGNRRRLRRILTGGPVRIRASVAIAAGALVAGCILIPTPPLGINEIPAERLKLVRPGTMTRADVLMALGDPDNRLFKDRVFVYRWTRIRAVGGIMYGPPLAIGDEYAFVIEFDAEGRVARSGDLSAFTSKGFQEELDLRLRDIRASTGMTGDETVAPIATDAAVAAVTSAPQSETAPTIWFDGPALWRPELPSWPRGTKPPAAGVPGRLVVSTDGVVFFERLGSGGSEAPYRVAREAIVRAECALPSFAILRTDGTRERFVVLRAVDDAYDDTMTTRVCRLVDDSLKQAPR